MPEPRWWSPRLTVWVDLVETQWEALGIDEPERRRLRQELVADLGRALLSGAAADDLIAADAGRFAEDVAMAEGIEPSQARPTPRHAGPVDRFHLVVVALAGAVAGGLLSLITVYPIGIRFIEASSGDPDVEGALALCLHVLASLLAAACGGAAVRWHFRHLQGAKRLGFVAAAGLLASGAVAAYITVAFARTTDYSNRTPVVFTELVLVLFVCALGMLGMTTLLRLDRSD